MKKLTLIARLLFGFILFGSGVSFFFITPPPMEGPMGEFFNGMLATKYFFLLLKGTEIACGLMLLSGYFVPLALVILAPIVLNIFLVHLFLAPEGLAVALVLGVLEVYLAFFAAEYSSTIKQLFRPR